MTIIEKLTAVALAVLIVFSGLATIGLAGAMWRENADRARDDVLVRQCIGQGLPEIACIGAVRGVSQ